MSTLKLFTDPQLPRPQRVHLVINELNLDVCIQTVDLEQMEHKTPDYLQLDPFRSSPLSYRLLRQPLLILYESRAIARYLAAKYGQGHLIPDNSDMQAFEQAACIELATFDMLLTGWFRAGVETVFFHWPINERQGHGLLTNYMYRSYFQKDNPYPDEVMVVRLRERISEILDVLDGILSRQEYMGGDTLSVVDLFYMPYMHCLAVSVWPSFLDSRAHLTVWWESMKGRSCYRVLSSAE